VNFGRLLLLLLSLHHDQIKHSIPFALARDIRFGC